MDTANEGIVAIANYSGFTPLELVLMSAIGVLFGIIIKYGFSFMREMITAINNGTSAIRENTKMQEKLVEKFEDYIKH